MYEVTFEIAPISVRLQFYRLKNLSTLKSTEGYYSYLEAVLNSFGPGGSLYEHNFVVDTLISSMKVWVEANTHFHEVVGYNCIMDTAHGLEALVVHKHVGQHIHLGKMRIVKELSENLGLSKHYVDRLTEELNLVNA